MGNKRVLLTAHSGAEGTKPNSMDYLHTAVCFEPDIIEVDLNLDEHGRRVISHDRPSSSDRVLFIDVLRFMAGHHFMLNIDVKDIEALPGLKDELIAQRLDKRCFLTGLTFYDVEAAKESIAGMRHLVNIVPEETSLSDLGSVDYCQHLCERVKATGSFGLNINYRFVTGVLMEAAARSDLKGYVWTVDDGTEMLRMAAMGAESITTNKLQIAVNNLRTN